MEEGCCDSTLTAANTSHTWWLPLTLTKLAAKEVPHPSGHPCEFPVWKLPVSRFTYIVISEQSLVAEQALTLFNNSHSYCV